MKKFIFLGLGGVYAILNKVSKLYLNIHSSDLILNVHSTKDKYYVD